MIIEESVNKFIRDLINTVLAIPNYSIRASQNGPRPQGPYCSVNLLSSSQFSQPDTRDNNRLIDPDLDRETRFLNQMTYSISFYRDGYYDNAHKVRHGIYRDNISELFKAANMGFIQSSDIRNIDEALETGWESRAQFDLSIYALGADSEIIRSIESVTMDLDFQTRDQNINQVIEVQQ